MEVAFIASLMKLGKDDELVHPSVVTQSGSVLIGSDQMWKVLAGEVSRCEGNELLTAMNSKLGWTFQGSTTHSAPQLTASRMMVRVLKVQVAESDESLHSFLGT
ncbi:hypothetical protein HPB50_017884 [Hyalomma asiaticum]|uniref:Uncharacterized protein n=1 Tax=Hyalomma asiaticum TaxID=266040 RepID=A0ACB7T2Q4_HYAAI|nr:hypothetical protein HPB50_017884 [Hyalomma asiaticum]